jgi:hypothetical protein
MFPDGEILRIIPSLNLYASYRKVIQVMEFRGYVTAIPNLCGCTLRITVKNGEGEDVGFHWYLPFPVKKIPLAPIRGKREKAEG